MSERRKMTEPVGVYGDNELQLWRWGFDGEGAMVHKYCDDTGVWKEGDYQLIELKDGSVLSWVVEFDPTQTYGVKLKACP